MSLTRSAIGCMFLMISLASCSNTSGTDEATRVRADATASPVGSTSSRDKLETVQITLDRYGVSPSNETRVIQRGQSVLLRIEAEVPGQLHVHDDPERVIEFPGGSSEISLELLVPGIVEVEDHALGTLIVRFEVT